jgi:hypothetical protein
MSEGVMADGVVVERPMSEVERVADTLIAPSKTFSDILRSTSWWLPYLLLVLVSLGVGYTTDKKVGFEQAALNQLHQTPSREEQVNSLPPEQKARQIQITAMVTKYITYAIPVIILILSAIAALVLWGSFNFGLGARTTFGQMFAVYLYATLPMMLTGLLTIATLLFGGSPETFVQSSPVGTNPAYYMTDAAPWLRAGLSYFDVFGLWRLALLVLGTSIVAKVKIGSAAAVVVGWWVLLLLVTVGFAAASS